MAGCSDVVMFCKYVHSKIPVCLVLTVTRANTQLARW